MKGIMIAATSSGTGKTTLTCGVLRALFNRGYQIQPYKVGPDYIDTTYHELACGRSSKNMDEFILGRQTMRHLYAEAAAKVDLSVIEGVMGLYDGYQADSDYCSSASTSKILGLPVVLVMNCKAMAASAAAMAQGFVNYDRQVKIRGFILNHVNTENHFNILKNAIEKATGLPVLGRLPKNEAIVLSSRHLGLIPQGEVDEAELKVVQMAKLAEQYIDLDKLIEISENAEKIETHSIEKRNHRGLRLAVAMDKAFNFYYEDSLNFLRELGVELIFFSPLQDKVLPDCDGIYIGGGYPEIFAKELEKNHFMRTALKEASQNNMPIYAECGGLMYLGESLQTTEGENQRNYKMVGVFSGKSVMTTGLKRFGYCTGTLRRDSILGKTGKQVRGHEFHHSVFNSSEETLYEMHKLKYDGEVERWNGGYQKQNTMASYLHTHFCSDYDLAYHFCEKMEAYRAQNI